MSTTSIDVKYSDEYVTVTTDDYVDGNFRFAEGVWKVQFAKGLGLRSKTFKGEMAWCNSRRYVEDELRKIGVTVWLNW